MVELKKKKMSATGVPAIPTCLQAAQWGWTLMTRVAAYLSVTWYPHPHPVSPQPSTQGRPPLPHLSSPLVFPVSSSATPTLAPPEVSGFCGFLFMFCFTVSFSFLLLEFLLPVQSWAGLCTCRPYFYLHMICALQYNTDQLSLHRELSLSSGSSFM